MADTGAPHFLPYPVLTDETDFPRYTQNLAEASNAALLEIPPRIARQRQASHQALPVVNQYYVILWDAASDISSDQQNAGITYNTSTGIFTVARSGLYMINSCVYYSWAGSVSTNITLLFMIGTTIFAAPITSSNVSTSLQFSRAFRFAAGDTFYFQARSSSAIASIYGAAIPYSTMDATLIAP